MLGLSAKDCWLLALQAIGASGFLAAGLLWRRLISLRALMAWSTGFSVGLVALAIVTGLLTLR